MYQRILDLLEGSDSVNPGGPVARGDAQWQVAPGEALDLLSDIVRLENQTQALRVQLILKISESGIWAEEGFPTVDAYIRHHLNLDRGVAKRELKFAERLKTTPTLAAAFSRGKVNATSVRKILSVGYKSKDRARVLPEFEAVFTKIAAEQPLSVLSQCLTAWADQVDPVETIYAEQDAHQRRYLRLSHLPDGCHIDGFLPTAQGMELAAALNAIAEGAWREGNQANVEEPEDAQATDPDACLYDIPQTVTSQNRADALLKLAQYALAKDGLPAQGKLRPNILVTVPVERLERHSRQGHVPDIPNFTNLQSQHFGGSELNSNKVPFSDGVSELMPTNGPGRVVISGNMAQQLACDCTISRVILSASGVPLDVGRSTRSISPGLRKALIIRDKVCIHPHCDRPAAWCDAHHVQHWAQGGDTKLNNLVLLCEQHHAETHDLNNEITFDQYGIPSLRPNYSHGAIRNNSSHRRRLAA